MRVHNLPVDARLHAELLEAGVALLGTKDLPATRRALHHGDERGNHDAPDSTREPAR